MGEDLLDTLKTATGLPEELIEAEIKALIQASGRETHEVTLEDLRQIMADYVQEILLQAKEHYK